MMVEGLSSISAAGYQGQGGSVASTAPAEAAAPARSVSEPVVLPKGETEDAKKDSKSAVEANGGQPTETALKKAVEQINSKANSAEAVFGVHEATNRVTIKMVDKSTKEVIKEFPAEETLDLIAKAWELAGIMVDEKR